MDVSKKIVALMVCMIMVSVPVMVASDVISGSDYVGKPGYATIVYDLRETQDVEKSPSVAFTVKTPDPRPGQEFLCWVFNGKEILPGEHVYSEFSSYPSDIWFFNSKWKGNEYTATFKDGTEVIDTKTCVYGEKIGELPTATKSGFVLLGWSPTGQKGDIITSDTIYSTVGDQEYQAVWVSNRFTVTLIDGGQTHSTMQCIYGEPYGDLPVLTKDGYDFVGWSQDESGTSIIDKDTKYLKTEDSNLYAVWTPKKFTITFMDGDNQVGTKTVDYNSTIGEMPTVSKTGKKFVGWSTDGTKDSIVGADTKYTSLQNTKLYAVWEDAPTSVFDSPISIIVVICAILVTIGIAVWVYRKGLI